MKITALPGVYWTQWLEWPLRTFQIKLEGGQLTLYKVVATAVLIILVCEIYLRTSKLIHRIRNRRDWLETDAVLEPDKGDPEFIGPIEAARNLEKTIEPLRKAKQYDRIAEIYASLNKHKEAAKWFRKARDRKRAAMELALAGYTVKAAKLLMKEGDYATAARFFTEKGRYADAAVAFAKLGDMPSAAAAYARAGKALEALRSFQEYFANTRDAAPEQVKAAESCYTVLQEAQGNPKVPADMRQFLLTVVAVRFEQAKRYDLAARLFHEAGQVAHAGEVFLHAGKLEEAVRCMRAAGKTKEAYQIAARFYEQHEQWSNAGAAHAGGGEFRRAGDCYARANDAARSAECYEKAGEFYGAALAYSHLGKFDQAIHLLQKIKESDKLFDTSRALLGRCFYELHDYAHCAAALDNHLTGKRVETGNIEYFYMLALAYEQLGQLEESQKILYKIQSVNVDFKDVGQRLSNIASRISMQVQVSSARPSRATPADAATQVMGAVETMLGMRYRLERELGRGGMGVVYLARDTQLDRLVAVKFLGSLMDESDEYRQRFIREARAAAKVAHPNIVAIYDINASIGKAHIVMEYVEGPSLHRHIRDNESLPPREAINLVAQACSALEAIHKVGIVHRDIKPDNILLSKGGLVKLTDFGLAKNEQARITATNVVMGTPAYMSPEQTRGSDVDLRSDIYSIGLVLHEALTGKTVFTGPEALLRQEREMPPLPSAIVAGIPELLDQVVMKCLAKDPGERYQTVPELLAALRQVPV